MHFLLLYIYHVDLACLKVRVGILFHKHLFQSTGYITHSPHIYLYIVSYKYIWVDRMKQCFAGFFFYIFILN